MKKTATRKITFTALFFAIGLTLPFLTGQIPEIGNALCPMHLPVFLCGFICGYPYGLLIGITLPITRSVIFQAPILYPKAIAMAIELACYGFFSGFIFKKIKTKNIFTLYLSLISAMIIGRIVWGIAEVILLALDGGKFTFALFITNGFLQAIPAIILQLLIIPAICELFKKLGYMDGEK